MIMGQVLLAGTGQVPARQAATAAGIPMTTPAAVVNKVCLSGLNAIYQADLMIAAGDAEIVVAGGMESMTAAPHLLLGARQGYRLGDAVLHDALMYDGLEDAHSHEAMGLDSERYLPQFPARDPRAPGRLRGGVARKGGPGHQGRPAGRRDHAGRGPPAQGRPAHRRRPTRASGPAPPPSRWPACGRRSAGTGPSRPATPRRSPTAASAVVVMSEAAAERHGVRTPRAGWSATGWSPGPTPA